MNQARFQKQQREKDKRERKQAKEALRAERRAAPTEAAPTQDAEQQAKLLADLAALHERFAAGDMDFEDFTAAREELTARLDVG